jgi:hypothetical protein
VVARVPVRCAEVDAEDVVDYALRLQLTDYEGFDYDACSESVYAVFGIIHLSNRKRTQPDIMLGCLEHQLLSGSLGLRSLMKRLWSVGMLQTEANALVHWGGYHIVDSIQ